MEIGTQDAVQCSLGLALASVLYLNQTLRSAGLRKCRCFALAKPLCCLQVLSASEKQGFSFLNGESVIYVTLLLAIQLKD